MKDAEKANDRTAQTASEKLDIEHVYVDDDPRKWSNMRKASTPSIMIGIFSSLTWPLDGHTGNDRLRNDGFRPRREHPQP